ncbi:hypothetical protein NEAUS04_0523 [Nematocida ausubeli]|nr:hypothetical protein NEAUS04_0523 [Nematocida ausubeli]
MNKIEKKNETAIEMKPLLNRQEPSTSYSVSTRQKQDEDLNKISLAPEQLSPEEEKQEIKRRAQERKQKYEREYEEKKKKCEMEHAERQRAIEEEERKKRDEIDRQTEIEREKQRERYKIMEEVEDEWSPKGPTYLLKKLYSFLNWLDGYAKIFIDFYSYMIYASVYGTIGIFSLFVMVVKFKVSNIGLISLIVASFVGLSLQLFFTDFLNINGYMKVYQKNYFYIVCTIRIINFLGFIGSFYYIGHLLPYVFDMFNYDSIQYLCRGFSYYMIVSIFSLSFYTFVYLGISFLEHLKAIKTERELLNPYITSKKYTRMLIFFGLKNLFWITLIIALPYIPMPSDEIANVAKITNP